MPDIQVSFNGIEKLLKGLNPHKAASPDQLKPIVLQTLHKELTPILKLIFQKSLDTGRLPSIWKKANVSPIFKKGDKTEPANYRPISLTCVLCNVLEHVVASGISKHFTEQKILSELQHGFREKKSCETQFVMLVDELSKSMQSGKQTDLILLDFSKALGPILFLAYINDLPEQVRSRVGLFADDTAMYLAFDKQADLEILQKDLEILENWEKLWDISFNPSKCQVIHVTRRKTPLQTNNHLHGCVLESVPSAKYLGVTISEDLKWSEHISNITKKANQKLGFLKRNIWAHNKNLKSAAYKTLVRPQLEYASTVWSPPPPLQILT